MNAAAAALLLEFDREKHLRGLQQCIVELQDFERGREPRMPAGEEIVEPYLEQMFDRCKKGGGRVVIAEVDGVVAGYVTVLPKVESEELHDGDFEYALISDLVVLERFRGQGLGRKLLKAAELFARACKAKYLRIGVLAGNRAAEKLYADSGFSPQYIELEKVLGRS